MPKNRRVDEEIEEMLTVEHHDRDALQVAAMEVVVGLDVVLDEPEGELVAQGGELDAGVVAEMAAGATVEVDGGHSATAPAAPSHALLAQGSPGRQRRRRSARRWRSSQRC